MSVAGVGWAEQPDEHDYPAAADYLELIAPTEVVSDVIGRLRAALTIRKKAKDVLRASGLSALGGDNVHVAKDLHKIHHGQSLSPVLLVRGHGPDGIGLVIADGYHRVCAVHLIDEDADVSCRIVDWT